MGEQRGHVVERLLEPLVGDPQLQLAHAGRVDHERAAGKLDELAACRRVPSLAVSAELLRREQLLAREGVDERRLADAGGAEQRSGDAGAGGSARTASSPSPVTFESAWTGTSAAIDSIRGEGGRGVGCEVALREQHDRLRAALPREDEVALETAQVQVLVERA